MTKILAVQKEMRPVCLFFFSIATTRKFGIWVLVFSQPTTKETKQIEYTGSLAPADFSGAVFTCAHLQEIQFVAQISSLCDFVYISEGISSLMCFWLQIT